jgi:hypothetical protein
MTPLDRHYRTDEILFLKKDGSTRTLPLERVMRKGKGIMQRYTIPIMERPSCTLPDANEVPHMLQHEEYCLRSKMLGAAGHIQVMYYEEI